jgi:predicted RecB family endonuclease
MAKRESKLDRLARLTYAETQHLREDVQAIRKDMVTKDELRDSLDSLREEMRGHFSELKNMAKQTIADEAVNTVEIAHLRTRMSRIEKRVGVKAPRS